MTNMPHKSSFNGYKNLFGIGAKEKRKKEGRKKEKRRGRRDREKLDVTTGNTLKEFCFKQ